MKKKFTKTNKRKKIVSFLLTMVEKMNCIYRYKVIFFAETNKNVKFGACQRKVNNNKKNPSVLSATIFSHPRD